MTHTEDITSSNPPHVLFVAAENGALRGAKVGGIGDVIRDLPSALSRAGLQVCVVLPSYGFLHQRADAVRVASLPVRFRTGQQLIEVYSLPSTFGGSDTDPRMLVLHADEFAPCGAGKLYCDDPDDTPFATDANKYALFGIAVLEAALAGHLGHIDIVHLHDWHAAFVGILLKQDLRYQTLADRQIVFSIHNLALQGIRPLQHHTSSLQQWYPWLDAPTAALADPRWPDCVNPTAAAIRLADRVHTVSPTYAREIVQANRPEQGFHGGEGLQQDLADAAANDRLVGILNGIDYPTAADTDDAQQRADSTAASLHKDAHWDSWMRQTARTLEQAIGNEEHVRSVDWLAHQRALAWSTQARPRHVLTSIGRLVQQKAAILLTPVAHGKTALEQLLSTHQDDLALVLIGTGDALLEQQCRRIAAKCPNLLFINRYSAELADLAYRSGDVFLMPSSFEPCGISQLVAMSHGQPCLVHAVGGLVDTVSDGTDGFHFSGGSLQQQANAMLARLDDILRLRRDDPTTWQSVCDTARSRRHDWDSAASQYKDSLYKPVRFQRTA